MIYTYDLLFYLFGFFFAFTEMWLFAKLMVHDKSAVKNINFGVPVTCCIECVNMCVREKLQPHSALRSLLVTCWGWWCLKLVACPLHDMPHTTCQLLGIRPDVYARVSQQVLSSVLLHQEKLLICMMLGSGSGNEGSLLLLCSAGVDLEGKTLPSLFLNELLLSDLFYPHFDLSEAYFLIYLQK